MIFATTILKNTGLLKMIEENQPETLKALATEWAANQQSQPYLEDDGMLWHC